MECCIVRGCTGGWKNPDRILHEFPKSLNGIKSWLQQSGQDFGDLDVFARSVLLTQTYRMCSLHFTPDCYIDVEGPRRVLREDAVPTVFGQPSSPRAQPHSDVVTVQIKEEQSPLSITPADSDTGLSAVYTPLPQDDSDTDSISSQEQDKANTTPKCFIIGCPHGSEGRPLPPGVTLHNFPAQFSKVKVWLRQSGQHLGNPDLLARRILSNRKRFWLCSSHFGPDCYLGQGSVVRLKPDAVPTVFPKCENPTIKEEEDEEKFRPRGAVHSPCNAATGEGRSVRHASTITDPLWGVRSVGVLTRPILVKEAATCTSQFVKTTKLLKPQRTNADKGVQCSTFELNFSGDPRSVRPDYCYQAAAIQPTGQRGADRPVISVTPQRSDESALNGAHPQNRASEKGVPTKDNRLFLALEDVLISLMQHMVSSSFIEENDKLTTLRILRQILEIIGLLTGDKWVIGEKEDAFEEDEVPVKCGDVGVYFSPDEWDFIEAHKEMYIDVIPDDDPLLTEAQQDPASEEESASEDEAKPSPERQNSPEWKPQSDLSDFSDSDEGGKSDSSKKRKIEDICLGNPEIKIDYSSDGKAQIFWCLRCNVSLQDRKRLRKHLYTQRHLNFRADEQEVTCEDCSQVFSSRSAMIKHKAENHASKRYACTICGLEYDYMSQFIIHQRAHTGEKPFECDKCGKRFGHKCTLLVHRKMHQKGKSVQCSKCDRVYDTKAQLHRHERTHVPKKALKCPVCGEQFEQKSLFTRHKWEHEEEAAKKDKFSKEAREGGVASGASLNDVPQIKHRLRKRLK